MGSSRKRIGDHYYTVSEARDEIKELRDSVAMKFVENSKLEGQVKKLKLEKTIIQTEAAEGPESTFLPRSISSQEAIKKLTKELENLKSELETATIKSNQDLGKKNSEITKTKQDFT